MTPQERAALLQDSIAIDPRSPTSQRFAFRRTIAGLEFFTARMTQVVKGDVEFHGYPTRQVPVSVLRAFRDQDLISQAEYRSLVKRLA